jgi:16S rRNA G966 N2-methylase RsmD
MKADKITIERREDNIVVSVDGAVVFLAPYDLFAGMASCTCGSLARAILKVAMKDDDETSSV